MCWAASEMCAASSEEAGTPAVRSLINGLLLEAVLPDGKRITFAPSVHTFSWDNFSEAYKEKIFQAKALVSEKIKVPLVYKIGSIETLRAECESAGADTFKFVYELLHDGHKGWVIESSQNFIYCLTTTEEDQHHLQPIFEEYGRLICKGSMENARKSGWLMPEGEEWPESSKEVAKQCQPIFDFIFEKLEALELQDHFPHLKNVYQMKPGVVAKAASYLSYLILPLGMDMQFSKEFRVRGKPVDGVETVELTMCLSSVMPKILQEGSNRVSKGSGYTTHLFKLHDSLKKRAEDEPFTVRGLAVRNKAWMLRYSELIEKYSSIVCMHGQSHFFGVEGLLNLGQLEGWKWAVYNYTSGEYQPFRYIWDGAHPFLSPDSGEPLIL